VRPFSSVGQALRFYFRHGEALAEAGSLSLDPRVDGADGRGRRDDLLAVYLSIGLCLRVLSNEEAAALERGFSEPEKRQSPTAASLYHRAMTKLGREMRQRGVVG
jgi:hypothetical protein